MKTYHLRTVIALTLATLVGGTAAAADIKTISHGDEVDIRAATVTGKYTLFDFYADWCGPCRSLDPQLKSLASRFEDRLALRKVDIVDWQSSVARQYRMSSIPHLKLFDPQGQLLSEGNAPMVLAALDRALGGGGGGGGTRHASEASSAAPFLAVILIIAVISAVLFMKRRDPATAAAGPSSLVPPAGPVHDPEAAPSAAWFVMMQGSLAGPFTPAQLADLERRKCIDRRAQVRRKGDREWRSLDSIL